MRTPTAIAALLMSLAALSACISYDVIPAAELATRIRPGDRVLVETHTGEELSLKVIEVDSDEAVLVGKDRRVAFADIAQIERRRVSWGRTA